MKKIIPLVFLIPFGLYTYAQQIPADSTKTKEHFFQKGKSQKTTAVILLSAGGAALFIGVLTGYQQLYDNNTISDVSAVLIIGGAASVLGSIPFFIAYHNSKQKALQLSVGPKMEENGKLIRMYAGRYQPAIPIRLKLR
jgi:hypothetical protein